jgi:hypothetical protein
MEDLNLMRYVSDKHYGHLKKEKSNIDFLFLHLNETNILQILESYSFANQFNMNEKMRVSWDRLVGESLTGTQEDTLIYLCNMFFCEKHNLKRREKLRRL